MRARASILLRRLALALVAAAALYAHYRLAAPEPELPPPPPPPVEEEKREALQDLTGAEFQPTGIAHLDTALTHVGAVERPPGSNRGPQVDRFLAAVGISGAAPWCAAFTAYVLRAAGADVTDERGRSVLSAVATRHIVGRGPHRSIDARDVLRGAARPEPGALVIWRNGANWTGHIGLVVEDDNAAERGPAWYLRCGHTVEGNTSPGAAGSQRDGDGVWRKTRCIEPGAYWRIVSFTPVEVQG